MGTHADHVRDAQLVFQSDQTGYFSLAIGHAEDGTLVNHVGCAAHPREADSQALAALKARGVTDGAVVNRFFDTEARINCLLDILSQLDYDPATLSEKSRDLIDKWKKEQAE